MSPPPFHAILAVVAALPALAPAGDCERWTFEGLRPGLGVEAARALAAAGNGVPAAGDLVVVGTDAVGRRWAARAETSAGALTTVSARVLATDEASVDELLEALVERWGQPVAELVDREATPPESRLWIDRACDVSAAASKMLSPDGADWSLVLRIARGRDWPVRDGSGACDLPVHTPGVTATRPVTLPGAPVSIPAAASCVEGSSTAPVVVELVVRKGGRVDDVVVRRARAACLREAALAAARSWRYLPGICSGRPVDVRMMVALVPVVSADASPGAPPPPVAPSPPGSGAAQSIR